MAGPTDGWVSSVFEMEWDSTQLAGRGLLMVWEVKGCYNEPAFTFAEAWGPSPLGAAADGLHIQGILANTTVASHADACDPVDPAKECGADGCNLISRVFSDAQTFGSDVDVGLTLQQPFDQYHAAFFNGAAPADYTALDAA